VGVIPTWQSEDGSAVLYRADCLEVLPTLAAGSVDAVVTDPPYGIGWHGHDASTKKWKGMENDTEELDLRSILNMPCLVVAFGANCYPAQLPHRGRWLCWDKRVNENADRMLGSPFELAWCNKTSGFDRIYRIMHGGVVNADGWGIPRVHPTQKPVRLIERILEDLTGKGQTILDPFMGSGTTGVACVQTGRRFVGIEISEQYFQIARRRIEQAMLQTRMGL
jgi:DNA modification methylase